MADPVSVQPSTGSDPREWVSLHGDALFRFALIRVRDQCVAEDVVQETFLAALRARETFAGQATERTWMTGILRKKIADHFRKQSRERLADDSNEQAAFDSAFFDSHRRLKTRVQAWPADVSESISNREFWRVMDECIAKLPNGVAGVFTLRDLESMDTREICKILGITATNLGARLHRARMWMRKCLERNWFVDKVRKGTG